MSFYLPEIHTRKGNTVQGGATLETEQENNNQEKEAPTDTEAET